MPGPANHSIPYSGKFSRA